jgi:serine/threonine protein kinase
VSATAEVGSTTNSYELLAKLAIGGMAEIFLARANAAGVERYVVLKRVLSERARDLNFMQMFLDEARLAAQLQHANIAQVHDIGKVGDSFFFTMEYVHGETLSELIRRTSGEIPIGFILTIIAGACAGLHYAHDRIGIDGKPLNIVHRDVSPSNLMITYEGTVKILDFGVAKATRRTTETAAGTVKGKLSYMSPEQCRGHDMDRRSDLFSLGIVMWEMLTGERLFKRATEYEHMEAIVLSPTPAPSTIRATVPPEVDAIVGKLLAKAPADRYQTADDLLDAIEAIAVRTGSILSTSGLGRFVREICGRRPEPWIEHQQVVRNEIVTVTTEPLPETLLSLVIAEGTTSAKIPDSIAVRGTPGPQPAIAPTRSYSYSTPVIPTAPEPKKKPRSRILVGVAVVAIVAAGALAYALWPRPQQAPPAPPLAVASAVVAPIDAAIAVAVAPAADAPEAAPIDAAVAIATHETHTAESRGTETARAFRAGRYSEVVAMCASNTVVATDAPQCVLAACRLNDITAAQRWFASVPARKRLAIANLCEASGTVVVEGHAKHDHVTAKPDAGVPAVKDCKKNPLDCQF